MLGLPLILSVFLAGPVQHPVYPPQYGETDVASLRSQVSLALTMSPEALYHMVPEASGIFFCGCPHCDGGTQENGILSWNPDSGDSVRCKYCKTTFPNDDYPYNKELRITAPGGQEQVYRWHEADEGRQYFLEANAWYQRWGWTRTTAWKLANLYALTGDVECGDRAAAIVGRYAQVYPDYAIRFDYPFHPVQFWPADKKWPYEGISPFRGAKFYWWGYGDIPEKLARSYDLLANGDSFERMKDLLGEDVRDRVENDLIRLGYEFTAANPDSYGNMSPGLYANMVVAGRIVGEPAMVHTAVDRFRTLLQTQFFFDGWWRECAPSYHWQTVGNLESVVKVAKGYSDPEDFPEPRLEDLDLENNMPLFRKAYEVGYEACLPDGRLIPVNDTWWFSKKTPLKTSISRIWSGSGHAILGAGKEGTQFQTHVNWNGAYGHTHMDSGSILLYAFGKELLSDIGYTHTRYRNWTINSASHNMVVVDQRSQNLRHSDGTMTGNVLFFDDSHPHLQAIDLDLSPAYPQCETHRRKLLHIHAEEGRDYLVDIFHVRGGKIHDFFLHGSADEEGDLSLTPTPDAAVDTLVPSWGGTKEHTGENCTDISGENFHPYWFLWSIQKCPINEVVKALWRYGDVGLDSRMITQNADLYCFQSPAIRKAGKEDSKLHDYLRNGVLIRRNSEESHFITVHAPFTDKPWLEDVMVEDDRIILSYGNVEDEILWNDAALEVRSSAGWEYESGVVASGEIVAVERDEPFALQADAELPNVSIIRLDFADQRKMIYRVARTEGSRFILSDDPGFRFDQATNSIQFLYHPHETFPAPLTWTAFTAKP